MDVYLQEHKLICMGLFDREHLQYFSGILGPRHETVNMVNVFCSSVLSLRIGFLMLGCAGLLKRRDDCSHMLF